MVPFLNRQLSEGDFAPVDTSARRRRFVVRVLLRPHREPALRIAWVVVIVAVPLLSINCISNICTFGAAYSVSALMTLEALSVKLTVAR